MEHCSEEYILRFPPECRKDFPPDDPVYKASKILSAWVDTTEPDYREGVPLGLVMTELGFDGDRRGLLPTSVVRDIVVGGEGLSFRIEDNFTKFEVTQALAEKLRTDLDVRVRYTATEEDGTVLGSDWISYKASTVENLQKEILDCIRKTHLLMGSEGAELSFGNFGEIADKGYISSTGPESDTITFFRPYEKKKEDCYHSYHLSEITDIQELGMLLRELKSNLEVLENAENFTKELEMKSEDIDIAEFRRDKIRDAYGSLDEYNKVVDYMEGFDCRYEGRGRNESLTAEDALYLARNAEVDGGGTADLSAEVSALIEDGMSPEQALYEWDIQVPFSFQSPERVTLRFDREDVTRLEMRPDGKWYELDFNAGTNMYCREQLLMDIRGGFFGFGQDRLGDKGISSRDLVIAMNNLYTNPINKEYVHSAKEDYSRDMKRRRVQELFSKFSSNAESKRRGIRR